MKLRQCKNFIHKYNKNIKIINSTHHRLIYTINAWVRKDGCICIHPKIFYKRKSLNQKVCLLHELGHITLNHHLLTQSLSIDILAKREYDANKFAYNITNDIKLKNKIISLTNSWNRLKDPKLLFFKEAFLLFKKYGY